MGKLSLLSAFELDEILKRSQTVLPLSTMVRFKVLYHQKQPIKQELGVLMAGGNLGKEKSDV